jgi:hypothetical protein
VTLVITDDPFPRVGPFCACDHRRPIRAEIGAVATLVIRDDPFRAGVGAFEALVIRDDPGAGVSLSRRVRDRTSAWGSHLNSYRRFGLHLRYIRSTFLLIS